MGFVSAGFCGFLPEIIRYGDNDIEHSNSIFHYLNNIVIVVVVLVVVVVLSILIYKLANNHLKIWNGKRMKLILIYPLILLLC